MFSPSTSRKEWIDHCPNLDKKRKIVRFQHNFIFLLTRSPVRFRINSMKLPGSVGKNIFWVLLLFGAVWFFNGTARPSASMSMMASTPHEAHPGHGVHSRNTMPSSCPMQGDLPCCHGKDQMTLCRASLCDLCIFSQPWQGAPVSVAEKVHFPVFRVIRDLPPAEPPFAPDKHPLHSTDPSRSSFFPPVNRPLLI